MIISTQGIFHQAPCYRLMICSQAASSLTRVPFNAVFDTNPAKTNPKRNANDA